MSLTWTCTQIASVISQICNRIIIKIFALISDVGWRKLKKWLRWKCVLCKTRKGGECTTITWIIADCSIFFFLYIIKTPLKATLCFFSLFCVNSEKFYEPLFYFSEHQNNDDKILYAHAVAINFNFMKICIKS